MGELALQPGHRVSVFSLGAGATLLERVCRALQIAPGRQEERDFDDGEHASRPLVSVRGQDVYLVQQLHADAQRSIDDKLVRALFFLATLRDAGAARVTAVLPYLPFARQDRQAHARDPVSSRYVAQVLEAAGVDRVVTIDVHNPAAYENAFRVPTCHLTATPAFVEALAARVGERPAVVVSPDAGGVKRAERFRLALERQLGRPLGFAFVEKVRTDGVAKIGPVVGDVERRVAIIVDDLVASGATLVRAAMACRQRGVAGVYAAATHAVFSGDAAGALRSDALDRLVVLDTIPPRDAVAHAMRGRLDVIECAPLLAAAIHRLHTDGSVSDLSG